MTTETLEKRLDYALEAYTEYLSLIERRVNRPQVHVFFAATVLVLTLLFVLKITLHWVLMSVLVVAFATALELFIIFATLFLIGILCLILQREQERIQKQTESHGTTSTSTGTTQKLAEDV